MRRREAKVIKQSTGNQKEKDHKEGPKTTEGPYKINRKYRLGRMNTG